jgi:hypothetical protein
MDFIRAKDAYSRTLEVRKQLTPEREVELKRVEQAIMEAISLGLDTVEVMIKEVDITFFTSFLKEKGYILVYSYVGFVEADSSEEGETSEIAEGEETEAPISVVYDTALKIYWGE